MAIEKLQQTENLSGKFSKQQILIRYALTTP